MVLFSSIGPIFSPGAIIAVILSEAKDLGTRAPPREYTRSFAALRMTLAVAAGATTPSPN